MELNDLFNEVNRWLVERILGPNEIAFFVFCLFYLYRGRTCLSMSGRKKYPVSAYSRTKYYRNDGTHVNAAEVNSSCREYRPQKPLINEPIPKIPQKDGS